MSHECYCYQCMGLDEDSEETKGNVMTNPFVRYIELLNKSAAACSDGSEHELAFTSWKLAGKAEGFSEAAAIAEDFIQIHNDQIGLILMRAFGCCSPTEAAYKRIKDLITEVCGKDSIFASSINRTNQTSN